MSYIFCLEDARHSDDWFDSGLGRSAFALQKQLLLKVWAPLSPQRVLQVGCGSGRFLEWFAQLGHNATGIDPSQAALSLARGRLITRSRLDCGYAERLPYDDNEFDTVALITSLEYVSDPAEALREACRVAARQVLIGALNKYSAAHAQHCLERLWKDSPLRHARFFSVFQLQKMAESVLSGPAPTVWRTCFSLPLPALKYFFFLERSPLLHLHPFGHFIAMRIDLRYHLRTAQTPVFSELPSRIGAHAPLRFLCRGGSQALHFTAASNAPSELAETATGDYLGQ